jgi:carboxypeptidase T
MQTARAIVWIFTIFIITISTFCFYPISSLAVTENSAAMVRGYRTYEELTAELHQLQELHGDITTLYNLGELYPHANGTIKTTWEGRYLWAMKVSDYPWLEEPEEPDVLYLGCHHGNEKISVEVPMYFLNYLVDNYGVNATVTELVDTREIWIVPMVNPDGHVWDTRKNRRDNGDGTYGVDLNRNYDYEWGTTGTSTNPSSNVYCGPEPFSEPETQLVRDLALAHEFVAAISYHSYGEMVLYPWGYSFDVQPPDEELLRKIAERMAEYNGYVYGQSSDPSIGMYDASGDTCDWLYGVRDTFAYTIELGTWYSGEADILPICEENLDPQVFLAKIADDLYQVLDTGIYGTVTDLSGNPVETVCVFTYDNARNRTATTDVNGEYVLKLQSGNYEVTAYKWGYTSMVAAVTVPTGTMVNLNFVIDDVTAPQIINVDSSVGDDTDEHYELGSEVKLWITEVNNEPGLSGTVLILSESTGYDSGSNAVYHDVETSKYCYIWHTAGLQPADDYEVHTTLTDPAGNSDLDGSIPDGPDLIIILADTNPPVIYRVSSAVGTDTDNIYDVGAVVRIYVLEKHGEPDLTGTVRITSNSQAYDSGICELIYDANLNYYYYDWDTKGLKPADDYEVNVTLTDPYGNSDFDGLYPGMPDLIIKLVPVIIHPIISMVSSAVGEDTSDIYEIGSVVKLIVIEEHGLPNLAGTVRIWSLQQAYASGTQPLTYDPDKNYYYYLWATEGLKPSPDYYVETTLKDEYGNEDRDGLPSTPDLIITLQDTLAPEIIAVSSEVNGDTDNMYEIGALVRIIVIERNGESGLSGEIYIGSAAQNYYLTANLTYNSMEYNYYYDWDTTGLKPSADYEVNAVLRDIYGNEDSDGVPTAEPDLTIVLTYDTTPPPTLYNLTCWEDATHPGWIHITWEGVEPRAIVYIYRALSRITEITTNLTLVAITLPDATTYLDIVPPDGTAYYYAVIVEDMYGNLNTAITDNNSLIAPVVTTAVLAKNYDDTYLPWNMSEDENMQPPREDKRKLTERESAGLSPLFYLLIVGLIAGCICIIIVIRLYYRDRRGRHGGRSSGGSGSSDWRSSIG